MGHFGKFCHALWAIPVNVVMRYEPLRQIWLYAMGHCGRFGYTPWATAVELVMRYGPLHGIKLHSKKKDLRG
jgi:hypothetical protein